MSGYVIGIPFAGAAETLEPLPGSSPRGGSAVGARRRRAPGRSPAELLQGGCRDVCGQTGRRFSIAAPAK